MRIDVQRRMASTLAFALKAGVVALALAGCGDSTAVKLTDIVGSWNLVNLNRTNAETGETTDAMQLGGATMLMTIAADGTVTTVTVTGSDPAVNGGGTIAVSGNRTKLVLDGTEFYGNIFLKGEQLTVDCGATVGLEEFSRITFVFHKQ